MKTEAKLLAEYEAALAHWEKLIGRATLQEVYAAGCAVDEAEQALNRVRFPATKPNP